MLQAEAPDIFSRPDAKLAETVEQVEYDTEENVLDIRLSSENCPNLTDIFVYASGRANPSQFWCMLSNHRVSTPVTGRFWPFASATSNGDAAAMSLPDAASLSTRETDESLMDRLRKGEERALGILFDRYARLVFSIALRIIHDRGEAEEIVQEIFLQLAINPNKFDASKGTARAWISHLAVHKSLDRHTYLARRKFYDGIDLEVAQDALAGAEDLEGLIHEQTTRAQLQKGLEDLTPKQRITLEWFFFEECTLREISERLGESHNNVRHHFYRGLEKLRKSPFIAGLRESKHAE